MPVISGYIERYGERGFMDPDYQIETVSFASTGELTNAMPFLSCYTEAAAL